MIRLLNFNGAPKNRAEEESSIGEKFYGEVVDGLIKLKNNQDLNTNLMVDVSQVLSTFKRDFIKENPSYENIAVVNAVRAGLKEIVKKYEDEISSLSSEFTYLSNKTQTYLDLLEVMHEE